MIVIGGNKKVNQELLTVYVQDFDDNYHRFDDEPSTELERAARQIRRRYKTVQEYSDALVIYNEYMQLLMAKHGGPRLFKIKRKWDQIDDFIPPKPGFRNNEMNKYIHKNKIVVSSVSKGPVDTDRINDILNSYRELDGDAAVKIAEIDNVKDKTIKKIAEAANKYNNRTTRASLKSLNTLNHLNDYWVERQRRYKEDLKSKGKKVYDDDYGISQYYTGEYLDEDDDEDDTRVSFQGRLFDSKSADQLNLYRELSAMGWDAMKLARTRNISKGVMKVFKRDEKSKKKGKKKKDQFNATVADIIADGNYDSFEDYQNEMQNVTISSLFR